MSPESGVLHLGADTAGEEEEADSGDGAADGGM